MSVWCLVPCKTSVAPPQRQRNATGVGSKTPFFGVKNAVLGVVRQVSEEEGLLDTQALTEAIIRSPNHLAEPIGGPYCRTPFESRGITRHRVPGGAVSGRCLRTRPRNGTKTSRVPRHLGSLPRGSFLDVSAAPAGH